MRKFLLVFIFTISLNSVFSQKGKDVIDALIEDGEGYMEDNQYEKAYFCWGKLISLDKKNELYYKLKKGMSAIHIPAKKEEAIGLLEEVRSKDSTHYAIYFYLGEAYHHNYKFDQAITYLDKFIKEYPEAKERKDAEMYLEQSVNGKKLTITVVEGDIQNIGGPVNTEDAEYVPVISADETVLFYTYKGKKSTGGLMDLDFKKDPDGDYYEDVFFAKKLGDAWDVPKSISDKINTKHNDAVVALSPDGQELYTFYSNKNDGGDLYVCHLTGEEWSAPEKLGPNINTKYWEGSCSISGDGRHLYFASERPGGLGGRDIYVSEMQANGQWGPAVNLGPTINTKYNDDSPFIHPDGITLFFSSEGHNSIGGFDIMYSIKKDNSWISPLNMGYPLNTTDDDIYYVITAKGDKGYFSSTRTGKGEKGSHDIYKVVPGILGEKPVLALLKGVVYGNDVPMEAEFQIVKLSNNEIIGPFHSNKKSGRYLVALSPNEKYTIKVRATDKEYPAYEEPLDVAHLTKYVELVRDFHLAKGGYKDPHVDTIPTFNKLLTDTPLVKVDTPKVDTPIVDTPKVLLLVAISGMR
ncbi:MAG: PD40 domain-containing protein [Bacteroidia bacterium]|nr:PD40 domain-containing protein [Bacteroidia bacterium]